MQRSPIHTFVVVVVVVFDFQVCEIFVINEGKLFTKHVEFKNTVMTKHVDKICLQNMLNSKTLS